jgi:hypothetical protein
MKWYHAQILMHLCLILRYQPNVPLPWLWHTFAILWGLMFVQIVYSDYRKGKAW